ncbi:hypothetical protein WICPIJ_008661 [Wickerhamomyces pijperi]|uniref:Uncharacterized protein n=1 Tax=Wickerhamomyces pijperi TaxID=599730 RepID=A0A9P8PVL1_WICPI|nr:hypothetical protein WICPIJ_008661 [Wickerhamomyces pijperi]
MFLNVTSLHTLNLSWVCQLVTAEIKPKCGSMVVGCWISKEHSLVSWSAPNKQWLGKVVRNREDNLIGIGSDELFGVFFVVTGQDHVVLKSQDEPRTTTCDIIRILGTFEHDMEVPIVVEIESYSCMEVQSDLIPEPGLH